MCEREGGSESVRGMRQPTHRDREEARYRKPLRTDWSCAVVLWSREGDRRQGGGAGTGRGSRMYSGRLDAAPVYSSTFMRSAATPVEVQSPEGNLHSSTQGW